MNSKRALSYLGVVFGGLVGSSLGMQSLLYAMLIVFLIEEMVTDD